jgi:hypothetical protein
MNSTIRTLVLLQAVFFLSCKLSKCLTSLLQMHDYLQGGCSTPRIWAVHPTQFLPSCTYCTDYWWFYEFHLAGFWGGDPKAPMYKNSFSGCGGNSASQISRIEFRHDGFGGSGDKYVCLARIGVH